MFPRCARRFFYLMGSSFLLCLLIYPSIFMGFEGTDRQSLFLALLVLLLLFFDVTATLINQTLLNSLEQRRVQNAFADLAQKYNAALSMPRQIPLVGEMTFGEGDFQTRATLELVKLNCSSGLVTEGMLSSSGEYSFSAPSRGQIFFPNKGTFARFKLHYKIPTGRDREWRMGPLFGMFFPIGKPPTKDPVALRQQLSKSIDIDNVIHNYQDLHDWLGLFDDETLVALADAGLERIDFKPQEVSVVFRQIPLNVAEFEKALNAGSRLRDILMVACEYRRNDA